MYKIILQKEESSTEPSCNGSKYHECCQLGWVLV